MLQLPDFEPTKTRIHKLISQKHLISYTVTRYRISSKVKLNEESKRTSCFNKSTQFMPSLVLSPFSHFFS